MLKRLELCTRWLTTAFSYFMFGVGGLIITLMVPLMYCLPGGAAARGRRTRWLIYRLFSAFVRMMRLLGVVTYEIKDVEKLRGARLILANHPSLLDVVFLISMIPNASCVVKGRLTQNFFTRGPIRSAGYIINHEAADVIDAANRIMDNGQTLIIFPEGTRTDPGKPMHFRRGAANVAIRTGSAITPVLVYCEPAGLTKKQKWYQVPEERMHLRFLVMDEYPTDRYLAMSRPSRAARELSSDLLQYFNKELAARG